MNLLLLCHGALSEFGSFELDAGQEVQYRGNYGESLSGEVAAALAKALLENASITAQQIGRQISNYRQVDALVGPRPVKPDIELWATANPPCFVVDLSTGEWSRLAGTWRSTLGRLVRDLGAPLHLDLLCCTEIPDLEHKAVVKSDLKVKRWDQVFK